MNYLNTSVLSGNAKELPSKIKNEESENAFKNDIFLFKNMKTKKLFFLLIIIKLKKIN